MKKLLTFAAVSALIALGSVSWASTNLNSIKRINHEVVSSRQPAAMSAQSIKAGQASKPAAQTIVICKKTIPSGGTGFPFSWANGFGPLPPFTLDDGQCTTKNMTGQDHYNKFTENVPAGWTLTNISCVNTTTPLQIIGANSNPAFQPGDNTVTMDLNEANVTCTFVNQATGSQGNDCKGNLVTNGNFTNGLNSWSAAYGTPDYGNSMGAQDPGFVGMWGNMNPTIGEGLQQNLGANQLVSGKTYLVSLQVRRLNDKNKLPYAKFKVRASTAPLSSAGGGITVGLTGNITATTWTPVSFNWTAPAGGPFPFLTLSVENNSSVNDGSKTSYGHFDNICIREKPSLPCCECLGQVTTVNLDTGQSGPIDPIWSVNGNAAFTTPKVGSWISLPPASWIQPVPSPTPSSSVPPGVYRYSVSFNIPKCTIPSEVRLEGKFSADNSAKAYVDSPSKVVGTCPGPTCFAGGAPLSVPASYLTPGNHTLVIEVRNNESYSGLIVNAKLTRQCARGNPRQTTDHTINDAIGIR